MEYHNGKLFFGEWVNGERHGKGKYIYKDGRVVDCMWYKGMRIEK